MKNDLLIDSHQFMEKLTNDINNAINHIYIQTFSFEADSAGMALSNALIQSNVEDKRLIIDKFSDVSQGDCYKFSLKGIFDKKIKEKFILTKQLIEKLKKYNVMTKYINPLGFMMCGILNRNHKKIIQIDNNISYLGGINFTEHNFKWHDLMIRIEDESVADYLKNDFLATWNDKEIFSQIKTNNIQIISMNKFQNELGYQEIINVIKNAKREIYIFSPYFSDPFYELFRECAPNIDITLITPKENNWKMLNGYIRKSCQKYNIKLMEYMENFSHLKAILIDHNYLIFGSSNFDFTNYFTLSDILAITTDQTLISDFKKNVLEIDIQKSKKNIAPNQVISDYFRYVIIKMGFNIIKVFKS